LKVVVVSRSKLKTKWFDVDLPWLGKFRKLKFAEFYKLDMEERYNMIREVRGGGSITPEILKEMRRLKSLGEIYIYEEVDIKIATWISNHWHIEFTNLDIPFIDFDYIWLATGRRSDINTEPIFKNLLKKCPLK